MLEYFLYYLIIINILTFIIYGIDKEKAKRDSGEFQKAFCFFWQLWAALLEHGLE